MKCLNECSTDDDGNNHHNNNNCNWLGFSLSPHMKMEVTPPHHHGHDHHHHHDHHDDDDDHHHYYHQVQASSASAVSSYLSHSQQLNDDDASGICYGSVGENTSGAFHHSSSPHLAMMPLKSDGSLCIMEALTRSQQTQQVMVPSCSSPPKLEDFLGGATMGAHGYGGNNEREAMALSLDSIYYNSQNAETHQNHRELSSSLHLFSDPFRQQGHHVPYYSGISCNDEGIFQAQYEEHTNNDKEIMPQVVEQQEEEEEGIANCFRNFVAPQVNNGNGVVGVGTNKSLSLSMSPGSQSSCVTVPTQISSSCSNKESLVVVAMEGGKKRGPSSSGGAKLGQKQTVHRKSIDTFGQRTSQYRGVTRHRWTGRYEAHLWDNSCKKEGQTRKGRQVYLGGYDMEEKAARAYDLAALKYWGPSTHINFPLENYQTQLEEMKNMSRQEYVAHLRRKSSGFSRGASIYRGVTRHHQHGRWQARIGRVAGNKDLYLGTFSTQEEAAEAYDVAAIKFRGVNAVTNFDISRYDVEKIMASNTLLSGDMARRNNKDHNNNNSIEPRTSNDAIVEYNVVAPSHIINNKKEQQIEIGNNNNNNEIGSNWKVVDLYHHQHQSNSNNIGNYSRNHHHHNFNVALQDLIGVDSLGSSHTVLDVGTNFSNQSSLVTSLSSSREGTPPDKKVGPTTMLFQKQQQHPMVVVPKIVNSSISTTTTIASTNSGVNSSNWFSMSHMPVFAAWNDP